MANEFPGGVLVFGAANRTGVPAIPEAGAKSKCNKYVHLGMGLAGTRDAGAFGKLTLAPCCDMLCLCGGLKPRIRHGARLPGLSASPDAHAPVRKAQCCSVRAGSEPEAQSA